MTRARWWTILGVLAGAYLLGLGVLAGMMAERFRFDAVRSRILHELEGATERARAHAMEREHSIELSSQPSASVLTEGPRRPAIWAGYIEMVDAALARRDMGTAVRAWREAHGAALRTRAWRPLVEVGDALIRIGGVDGRRSAYAPQARRIYMAALTRARAVDSVDGVLRVAEAFAGLGDHAVVEECLLIATRLGARPDHETIVRLRALGHAADVDPAPRPVP